MSVWEALKPLRPPENLAKRVCTGYQGKPNARRAVSGVVPQKACGYTQGGLETVRRLTD